MKKIIKFKLLIVFAILFSVLIMNATGIEAKMEWPEPVIDLSENEINDNDAGISKKYDIGISDTDIISSLIRDDSTKIGDKSVDGSVQKSVIKTPAPFEKHDDSYIPLPTKSELNEEKVDVDSGASDDKFMPGEIIICFKEEHSVSEISEIIPQKKIVKSKDIYKSAYNSAKQNFSVDASKLKSVKEEIGKYYVITISDKSEKSVLNTIEELKKDPNIKYAEPNYICEPCVVPNDYKNYDLWNMDRIQMPETWNSYPGTGIKVGVLDTGIDSGHPDLKKNVDTSLGWNCALQSNTDTLDYNWHGTHVAGTIGAEANNSIGVVGVNPLASLVPIKICIKNDNTKSNSELMTEGILHATNNNIPVCNLSYSMPNSNIFRDAIKKYGENKGTLIVAAGNDGICIDNIQAYKSLAELDNVIIVANSNQKSGAEEELRSTSNYGEIVHVAAPGTGIYSTVPTSRDASGYKAESGTSMAAPHVTGVVSLLKGKYPDITSLEIRQAIMEGADFVPNLEGKVASKGRLNAKNTTGLYLSVILKPYETMADAIKRSLGSRSGSDIKMMKLIGVYGLIDGNSSRDSASAILPNLQYADVSLYKNELKKYSFYGCKNLTTVVLPEDNVKLPAYCFMNCTKLSTIHRLDSDNRKMNEADFTGLKGSSNGEYAAQTQCFSGCTSLKTIKLPNSTKIKFSQYTFDGCSNLDTVYIDTQTPVTGEADLTEFTLLNSCIFRNTGIITVKLPKDVDIGKEAFEGCTKLKNIQVHPQQIEPISVYDNSFYNVNNQCKVLMNQALYKSSYNFHRSGTEYITKEINSLLVWPVENENISDTIKYYLDEESIDASSIKNLVISGNVVMGNSTMYKSASILPNLEIVDMSSFTGSLGSKAFYNCSKLETVIRSSDFSCVKSGCFAKCSKLTTIMEADKYPKIWNEADLTDISGGIAVDTQGFDECIKLSTVKLPSISIGFAGSFSNCVSLSTIYKDGDEKQEGTFDLTGVSTFWPGWGHNLKNTAVRTVKLPRGVAISEYCFNNCSKLEEILFERIQIYTIGIGSYAFYGVKPYCEAYMDPMLAYNNDFQIKRSDTNNITKVAY